MQQAQQYKQMEYSIAFESYGVFVRIDCNDPDLLTKVKSRVSEALVHNLSFGEIPERSVDRSYCVNRTEKSFELFENGNYHGELEHEDAILNVLASQVRLGVAERAKTKVFVHAGVISVHGRVVMIPGVSYSGKTTLVAEFARRGVVYFSDEYAVLDENGNVHPFPRKLSVRGPGGSLTEMTAESLGATVATAPARVGLVLITEFKSDSDINLEALTFGNAMLELIPHTIPIRMNTDFALKTFRNALSRAIILKGERPEAAIFAEYVLTFIRNELDWANSLIKNT